MTGRAIYSPGAKTLRGWMPIEDFSVQSSQGQTGTAVPGSLTTDKDQSILTASYSGTSQTYQLSVSGDVVPSFVNRTPAVVSVTASGLVTALASGLAQVDAVTSKGTRRWEQLVLASQATVSVPQFQGYVAGSLARHITDQMLALIAGKTASDATRNVYSHNLYGINAVNINGDNQAPDAVRNASNFAAAIDLSGMTVGTYYAGIFPCALISPRHVIRADHVSSQGRCVWLGTNGQFYTATVKSSQNIGGDINIGYLDTPVPAAVKPFKVLPSNYTTYLPSTQVQRIPLLSKGWTAGDKLRVIEYWIRTTNPFLSSAPSIALDTQSVPIAGSPFESWFSPIISGDSSSPQWAVINGEAVLMGSLWNVTGCSHYGDYVPQIEAAMNAIKDAGDATVYALSHPDLSAFTSY